MIGEKKKNLEDTYSPAQSLLVLKFDHLLLNPSFSFLNWFQTQEGKIYSVVSKNSNFINPI